LSSEKGLLSWVTCANISPSP